MPNGQWQGSNRKARLPEDWARRRMRVLIRDGRQCTHHDIEGVQCLERATDVDHIRPGDDHSETNLRSLCSDHHQTKSSREGGNARVAQWRSNDRKFRRHEGHPGFL